LNIKYGFSETLSLLEFASVGDKKNDWTREELQKEYVEKKTAVTVPAHITIHGQQMILDLSNMESLLRNAEIIALEDCGCRTKWHKCDAPTDFCISLNDEARDSVKRGARRISLAQALVALQRSHRAGLVHMAFTISGKDETDLICNCRSCCCH
jgi:hypothetical protein